jgi:hypothetical protein
MVELLVPAEAARSLSCRVIEYPGQWSFGARSAYPPLPLKNIPDPTGKYQGLPADIMNAEGYRELLEACLGHGEPAIAKFRATRDRNNEAISKY